MTDRLKCIMRPRRLGKSVCPLFLPRVDKQYKEEGDIKIWVNEFASIPKEGLSLLQKHYQNGDAE